MVIRREIDPRFADSEEQKALRDKIGSGRIVDVDFDNRFGTVTLVILTAIGEAIEVTFASRADEVEFDVEPHKTGDEK